MPVKVQKMFTAWSFSRWKDWNECPLKARFKHIDKVPEPGPKAPALLRGEIIHKEAEDYTRGKLRTLPASLKLFAAEFKELRKMKAIAEGKWAMDIKWDVADFFDWKNAWCRVVLDAHYYVPKLKLANVIDHKTGKIYPDNGDQMELYAISGFAHYPMSVEVHTKLWYLDQGEEKVEKFTRGKDLPKLQAKWRKAVVPMLSDRKFLPRPGDYCGRCPFSQRKNGPCKY